jgi:uncharacterized surface protein with fasciclin (FAS1) repeats
MKIFRNIFFLVLTTTLLFSCEDDEVIVKTNTIVDVAVNNQLTSLVAAVTKADLATTLSGSGPFTVLAPTNDAFATFLEENNFNSLDDVPTSLLTQILLNHVIDGSLQSTDLSTGYANTKATSDASGTAMSIYINTDGGVKFNGISDVTVANVAADNGTVHVVNKVIGLPTVVTFATADNTFSTLVSALTRNDLTTNFVSILSTANGTAPAPFTVFAPTNTAFGNVLTELGYTMLSEIPVATLDSTLKYHVVGGVNVLDTALTDNMTVGTLGGDITANITGGATLTDGNGRVSKIIATNVQANNGVIHAIDKVVLPN